MNASISDKPLSDLVAEEQTAREELQQAEMRESSARSETTRARNHLNAAQKAIDEAMANLRKSAPRDSDWHRSAHSRQQMETK